MGSAAPIRVVHLVLGLSIGGLEIIVTHLARRASPLFEPRVICLERLGPLTGRLEAAGVPVECLGTPTTPVLRSVATLRRRLDELAPDVLHCHNEKAHIHGALATLGRARPALVHTRHGRSQATTLLSRAANRLAIHRSRFLVSVSDDASRVSLAEGASRERLRVILNGVDVSAYDASAYSGSRGARAVSVGRLSSIKDLGTLLRAARLVKDVRPDFALDIVGDGPSKAELESLCRELALEDAVTFRGASSDPRPFYATSALFAQSSLSEGVSLTLLEAMAAGLPVVATDVGGNREVVDDGQTGWLVAPQDPAALAAAILRVLNEPAHALAMSRAARARVEQRFDLSTMISAYEALYVEAAHA